MSMTEDDRAAKQHDLEETREEQSVRLTDKRADQWTDANEKFVKHLGLHLKNLSPDQKKLLGSFVRAECDQILKVIDTANGDRRRLGLTDLSRDWS